jgi:O-acetyl-ADP-ribose deacetylase (regulator of RNase III)
MPSIAVKYLIYDRTPSLTAKFSELISRHPVNHPHYSLEVLPYSRDVSFTETVDNNDVDTIVSPGNSYGFLGGGFDAAISDYYSGKVAGSSGGDITRVLQRILQWEVNGYNPPANAVVANMARQLGVDVPQLVHLPTMSSPSYIPRGSPIVFYCMWNLLCQVQRNNRAAQTPGATEVPIKRVIISGLGTGVGGVSSVACAEQMYKAFSMFCAADGERDVDYLAADEFDAGIKEAANAD